MQAFNFAKASVRNYRGAIPTSDRDIFNRVIIIPFYFLIFDE